MIFIYLSFQRKITAGFFLGGEGRVVGWVECGLSSIAGIITCYIPVIGL